ncbi:MAG: hypothetical protein CMH54_02250 [Myxococcales bacterium]|nr:hypothetical protein [Myxococcales bacterium]
MWKPKRRSLGLAVFSLLVFVGCGGSSGDSGGGDVADSGPSDGIGDVACITGAACDDSNPCTQNDQCQDDGTCLGEVYECTLQNDCTYGTCAGDGTCTYDPLPGRCIVDDVCYGAGETSADNPCLVCAPDQNATELSVSVGAICNDGLYCTISDSCSAEGVCDGDPRLCADTKQCTTDSCDEEQKACFHEPKTGACDDGDACTEGDVCVDTECQPGEPLVCPQAEGLCLVTECDSTEGCVDIAVDCDDGNSCTTDSCDPAVGCVNAELPDDTACDDENLCTLGDICTAGQCMGPEVKDCADDNVCTDDSCDPAVGCAHYFNNEPCDDGFDCSILDSCAAGLCAGLKDDCEECSPDFSEHANKITIFELPAGGNPGAGLDLDGNPETCSPPTNCSGGIDNALGVLGFAVNPSFAEAIEEGILVYLIEYVGLNFDGDPFTIHVYVGVDNDGEESDCDPEVEDCGYLAIQESFAPDCSVNVTFDNAVIENGVMTAGGPGSLFLVTGTMSNGQNITFVIFDAMFQANIQGGELEDGTPTITSANGIVGGGVPKQIIQDALNSLSDSLISPLLKDLVNTYLENEVEDDLDIDGDGTPDAASIGIRFETIGTTIVGIQ